MRTTILSLILLTVFCKSFAKDDSATAESWSNTLHDIVVVGKTDFFRVKGPNRFVYNVANDSTLKDAMAIDALKNVPILEAKNNGEVTAMNGKPLVFKVNGLRDPILTNLSQALTGIPANTIKCIEFKDETDGDGKNVIEVNIVTKGRLEGYRAQLTTNISDSYWRNGIWGLSKSRKFTFSGSYFNTWRWGHTSKHGADEYRFETPDFYRYLSEGESDGYKVDMHNFEVGASYEVDDKSFLNFYGGAMLKTDPRTRSYTNYSIYNHLGNSSASYTNINSTRMKDAEYSTSLRFDRNSGKTQLNIGYEFYTRPFSSLTHNVYENIEHEAENGIGIPNLLNSRLNLNKSYTTNTLVGEWKKVLNRRLFLEIYGKLRHRHESYKNQEHELDIKKNPTTSEYSKTSLNEFFGVITPKVLYTDSKRWEIRGGASVKAYRHEVGATGIDGHINNNKIYFLPFASIVVVTNKRMMIEASYNMGINIPDVTALDPYKDRTVAGEVKYGNPQLKAQTSHITKFSLSGRLSRLYAGGTLSYSYTDDVIMAYSFVDNGILNNTFGNIANRKGAEISAYISGRPHANTYIRVNSSLSWTQYRVGLFSTNSQGWQVSSRAYLEQELPLGITMDVSVGYNSRPVTLQGYGSHNFNYDIGLYRQFMKRKLTLMLNASSFIPVWFKRSNKTNAPGYSSVAWSREFHASFTLTARYTFGKLQSRVKESSMKIENDEIKQSYNE